jgi:hypothetical protein
VRIQTIFISDRGDCYLPGCQKSYDQYVGTLAGSLVVDDQAHEMGMAGAVQEAFRLALMVDAEFAFIVEEDFRFLEPIDLSMLAAILDRDPTLAQVVLLRQPWSPIEQAAGGIIQLDPFAYTEESFGMGCTFLRHGAIRDWGWSSNPTLIPRRTLELGWPDGNEREMTLRCLDAGMSFAFYGGRDDPPRVEHVGSVRSEGWRL